MIFMNPKTKRKLLILFDDVIADVLSNKKLNPIVTELFIRGRKLNISLVFITILFFLFNQFLLQSYFAVPKLIRLNLTQFQQIVFNHSSDINFVNVYKKGTTKPYSFLVIHTTLASDNFHFSERIF